MCAAASAQSYRPVANGPKDTGHIATVAGRAVAPCPALSVNAVHRAPSHRASWEPPPGGQHSSHPHTGERGKVREDPREPLLGPEAKAWLSRDRMGAGTSPGLGAAPQIEASVWWAVRAISLWPPTLVATTYHTHTGHAYRRIPYLRGRCALVGTRACPGGLQPLPCGSLLCSQGALWPPTSLLPLLALPSVSISPSFSFPLSLSQFPYLWAQPSSSPAWEWPQALPSSTWPSSAGSRGRGVEGGTQLPRRTHRPQEAPPEHQMAGSLPGLPSPLPDATALPSVSPRVSGCVLQ